MSISVYIGHNGRRLVLDPSITSTLEAVRASIYTQTDIPLRSQIILTGSGKAVRTQTLLTETELFVFDSSWLKDTNPPSSSSSEGGDDGQDFQPGSAPDTISNQNDLQSWLTLFKSRKGWATALLDGCSTRAKLAEQYKTEQTIIERSLEVAVSSLSQHIKNGEKKYAQSSVWKNESVQNQPMHAENWEEKLDSLRRVPARAEFGRFIQSNASVPGSRRNSQQHLASLQGFVDVAAVRQASLVAQSLVDDVSTRISTIREELDSCAEGSNELQNAVKQINHRALEASISDPAQLVNEIELVVKKMASDLDHVQTLRKTPQSLSQASKMALLHTRNYLPNLVDYCREMNEAVQRARSERAAAVELTWHHMRALSDIESRLAKLYQDIEKLNLPDGQEQPFQTMGIVSRLPVVYGHLLVESVRRREWVAKMKRDSSTLQEEVAVYQEEEDKRRKRWVRNVEDVVEPEALQSHVLGIELSLRNEGGSWPIVTREELTEYNNVLKKVYGQSPMTEEIAQAILDLDRPTRKQIKHAKAFKSGSMHEAVFGDTSLLLRGDEQAKVFRDANVRLEEDLKAQKSRVRKLEDLLHRQSQVSRANTGDIFTPTSEGTFSQRVATPPMGMAHQFSDDFSRRNSMSQPRRGSIAQAQSLEDKKLAKRIVDLEVELHSYKEEVITRKNSDAATQKQVEDAISIKKDLMQNMEAQQREFADERRALEKELREVKYKLEEAENEIERIADTRENVDDEIARLKEDAAGHAARAATEHDARNSLEWKLRQAEDARAAANEELQSLRIEHTQKRDEEAEQLQSLTTAFANLSPHAEAPSGLVGLAAALEELTRRSVAQAKDLEEAVALAKSENESLWSSNERQKSELSSLNTRQSETEDQVRQTEEKLAVEEAKAKSLEEQLVQEQEQVRSLRNKFAEGETGSEVLRQRATEQEERVGKLSSELAEAKSHVNSLDIELMRLNKKTEQYASAAATSAERLGKRAERAKDMSQRLYIHNLRLGRLLERLGLVITYQNDSMVIERASKLAASTTMTDPSHASSMMSPPRTRKSSTTEAEAPADLRLLHWADAQTIEDETSAFEAFLSYITRFDLDVFSEAVVKRVKDFEYTAKKYSKESKESTKRADAYKERAVKLRNEAHAKIAVRDFKEGDMALFLPTRGGQIKGGAWAAFNINCPHYFLAERDGMRLGTRDFIVARISKVEQKVVDLSAQRNAALNGSTEAMTSSVNVEDDNPFDLSDGLTWWMVHAVEERTTGAAPTTPGLGKSTVSTANVDAKGSIRIKRSSKGDDASKHLNKSLDSRRSSSTSKRGGRSPVAEPAGRGRSASQASVGPLAPLRPLPSSASGLGIAEGTMGPPPPPQQQQSQLQPQEPHEQVRQDLLWGP